MLAARMDYDALERAKECNAILDRSRPLFGALDAVALVSDVANGFWPGVIGTDLVFLAARYAVEKLWQVIKLDTYAINLMLDIKRLAEDPAADERRRVYRETPIGAVVRALRHVMREVISPGI